MKRYSIYRYKFEEADPDPLFPIENPVTDEEERRGLLPACFGKRGSAFILRSPQDGKDFPCVVLLNQDGIVMLHLERPKQVGVWEKDEKAHSVLPKIDKKNVPSNPFCYAFLDCRRGHNMIAIEMSSSAWRKTDQVKVLLACYLNIQFNNQRYGFNVRIDPETYDFDYLERQRKLIKVDKRKVKRMVIHFKRGTIDPEIEATVRHNRFINSLFNNMFKPSSTNISLDNPDVSNLIRRNSKLGEYFMMLIGSELDDSFGVTLTYDNHRSYEWGEDIRIDFGMEDEVLDSALGQDLLFPMPTIGKWFDDIEKDIEDERKATYSQSR